MLSDLLLYSLKGGFTLHTLKYHSLLSIDITHVKSQGRLNITSKVQHLIHSVDNFQDIKILA